jgi:hypothetical protein
VVDSRRLAKHEIPERILASLATERSAGVYLELMSEVDLTPHQQGTLRLSLCPSELRDQFTNLLNI